MKKAKLIEENLNLYRKCNEMAGMVVDKQREYERMREHYSEIVRDLQSINNQRQADIKALQEELDAAKLTSVKGNVLEGGEEPVLHLDPTYWMGRVNDLSVVDYTTAIIKEFAIYKAWMERKKGCGIAHYSVDHWLKQYNGTEGMTVGYLIRLILQHYGYTSNTKVSS